jgi:pimeloyl-ACP methyl ester carboxylesterase
VRRRPWVAALAAAVALAALPAAASADATSAPVRTARVGDVDLAYRSIGHGRPLVMIMGLGGTMDAWMPQLVELVGRGRRVVTFDNRGTGRSTAGTKPITVRTMAGDTLGLIRELHLRRPDVLGWSMGGFVAQELALGHPRDVDRLVLAATSAGGKGTTLGDADALGAVLRGDASALPGLLFPLPAQQAAANAYFASIGRWPDVNLTVPQTTFTAQVATARRWFAGPGAYPRLPRLRAPTLVGGGVEDRLIPPANQRVLARRIQGAKLVLYPGAGHGFLVQDWRSFGKRADAFLAAPGTDRRASR